MSMEALFLKGRQPTLEDWIWDASNPFYYLSLSKNRPYFQLDFTHGSLYRGVDALITLGEMKAFDPKRLTIARRIAIYVLHVFVTTILTTFVLNKAFGYRLSILSGIVFSALDLSTNLIAWKILGKEEQLFSNAASITLKQIWNSYTQNTSKVGIRKLSRCPNTNF
jgi:hypothetical protein